MQNHILNYLYKSAQRVPERIAFSDGGEESLSFAQLLRQTRAAGTAIHRMGIYKKPVVVFMKKSPAEIAAFFGVIAGGCFYVPIDEEMPAARIQLILDNLHPPLVICDRDALELTKNFRLDGGVTVLFEELIQTEPDGSALEEIHRKSIDTDPVYVVFTSGSTGIPKGVASCHRAVVDYIEQLSEVLELDENTVFGSQTPLYFDACLKEMIGTIKWGATAYLIPKNLFSTPVPLVEYLNAHRINTLCWVVSALTMISAFGTFDVVKPEYLRTVAFGSEVFPIKQFNRWREALPGAAFINLYGPTEGTGMCCAYRVCRPFAGGEAIPIGRPFPNREILLLTEAGTLAAEGEEGEICIRGTSLALGYYNDPERTRESFVQNPLNTAYPELIYKTGDIARRNAEGDLVFVSRKDYQIKHMGHRIELGEIEVQTAMLPGVQMAACIYDGKKGKIILYYMGGPAPRDLLAQLKEKLPRYMLPQKIFQRDAMPFTANGKLDRKALQAEYEAG